MADDRCTAFHPVETTARCHLLAGHHGPHEEVDTDAEMLWTDTTQQGHQGKRADRETFVRNLIHSEMLTTEIVALLADELEREYGQGRDDEAAGLDLTKQRES